MRTMFKSSNPAMRSMEKVSYEASAIPMTVQGTVNKTFIMLLLVLLTATITWKMIIAGNMAGYSLITFGAIAGFITALIAIFKPNTIHVTAPLYALFEGLLIGGVSATYLSFYQGIVIQAVGITIAIFAAMLIMYKLRILKASPAFVKILVIATGGIALYYLVAIVASFFSADFTVFAMPRGLGLGIQLFIVAIAALNLILDFNYIEQGSAQGLPKKMEWYGAFGLMVTLIWLYLEILRLLALLSRR